MMWNRQAMIDVMWSISEDLLPSQAIETLQKRKDSGFMSILVHPIAHFLQRHPTDPYKSIVITVAQGKPSMYLPKTTELDALVSPLSDYAVRD